MKSIEAFGALQVFGGDIYKVVWDTHFAEGALLLRSDKVLTRVLSRPMRPNTPPVTCKVISHDDMPGQRTIRVSSSALGLTIIIDATCADLEAWLQSMKNKTV